MCDEDVSHSSGVFMNNNAIDGIKPERLLSLDVFRGIIIVLMIIVNAQARVSYAILDHAAWDGFTLADLVFPSFLFIVGLTLTVSLNNQKNNKDKSALYRAILWRSTVLFVLGILLNAFPHGLDLSTIRVYGILQRIAVCYLVCSLIFLHTSVKTQIGLFFMLIWGYWLLLTVIPIPGWGAHQLTVEHNWLAYVDQLLFSSKHLLFKTYDPEGLISTIPSLATTLCGILIGQLLLSSLSKQQKSYFMLGIALSFLLLGYIWSYSLPINKNLWTSSFVFWSSGWSLMLFALCFIVIDIYKKSNWALVFKIFGVNALAAFVFHAALLKAQYGYGVILANGTQDNAHNFLVNYLFGAFNGKNASLVYSLFFLLFNLLVFAYLYYRKIFIKI